MPRKKKTDIAPPPELKRPELNETNIPSFTVMPTGEVRPGLQVRHEFRMEKDIAERLNELALRRGMTAQALANKLLRQALRV